ncbi:hypothetical protein D3C74_329030 [compost metagenome]
MEDHVRGVVLDAGVLQRGADRDQVGGLGEDLERVALVRDLLAARLQDGLHHVVLGGALLGDHDDALAGEQVGHRARVRELAPVARERDADLRGGTVLVVREALDQDRDAARAVALVHDRLVVGAAGFLARAALEGAVDVVVGDRGLLGLLDGVEERGVTGEVPAARAGRDLDVLDELGEQLAALGVDHGLLVLGRSPLGVS